MQKPDYTSPAENTLRKVLAQRFLTRLPDRLEAREDELERARVTGVIVKGSGRFAFLEEQPLLTRGPRDLDLHLCGLPGLAPTRKGKTLTEDAMGEAATEAQLELRPYSFGELALHEKLVRASRRKEYFTLSSEDSIALARSALTDESLRLTERDRQVLRTIVDGSVKVPPVMDINTHLLSKGIDICPIDKKGNPLTHGQFFGLGTDHPLANIAGMVEFINFYDDKFTVYPDLASATAGLNKGTGLLPRDVDTIKREMFDDPGSHYREYATLRKIIQLKDGITRGEPWRTLVHGMSLLLGETNVRFLHEPPTDERAERLATELNKRREANLIDREAPFTPGECKALLQHTHDLSRVLLNKEYELVPATGFGGETAIREMLHMTPPDDTTRKPETPGHIKEILSDPPTPPKNAQERRERGDGKEGQTPT